VVVLTALPAPLLEEALYSDATGILDIAAPVRDLEPPELDHGRDISVDRALSKEGPLKSRLYGWREGRRGHVALMVVREQLRDLGQWYLERLGQALNLCESRGVGLLRGLPPRPSRPGASAGLAGLHASQEDVLLKPGRELVRRDELAVWPAVARAVAGKARRPAPGL
jgi:hypothetical protein